MGHAVAKNIYKRLGDKLDSLTTRTPRNCAFFAILSELYSLKEAELVVNMPAGLATVEQLAACTASTQTELESLLAGACDKGLVFDLWLRGTYYYIPSPFIIGLYEFTMMRTGEGCDFRRWSALFHEYLSGSDDFYRANCCDDHVVALMRTVPHEETMAEYVEVLDYEKARAIVLSQEKFAVGICACRHEKHHLGKKECDTPLETCTSMGYAAEYLVRHNMAREISQSEMLEHLCRSQKTGLVLNADNVQYNVAFICHCCKCCCNALAGINKWGYANAIISSTLIAQCDHNCCIGCGKCADACPVNTIQMESVTRKRSEAPIKKPVIDNDFCLGCGVCGLQCATGAMKLVSRRQRVLHPENVFEKNILLALDRGTLEYQLFPEPGRITHRLMRAFLGGVARLPVVKKMLLSDLLRSRFLRSVKFGAKLQGREWMTEL